MRLTRILVLVCAALLAQRVSTFAHSSEALATQSLHSTLGGPGRPPAHGHLYVASTAVGSLSGVYVFDLDANGLPRERYSNHLCCTMKSAFSVGVDGAGYIYVGDQSAAQIEVYSPGETENDPPVRTISLAPDAPTWIAVDTAGYVYATIGYSIDVFAPGAGSGSSPINTIPIPPHDVEFQNLALDQAGDLYASGFGSKIYLYSNPKLEQEPDQVFKRHSEQGLPITVDDDQDRVYYRVENDFWRHWDSSGYGAVGLDFAPLRGGPWLFEGGDCFTRGSNGTMEYGLAVNKNYLMFSCTDVGWVEIYHNRPGRQTLPWKS